MAKVITDNQHYADIAAAIREKNETETLYKPSEMASAILEIQGGGDLNFEVVGGTTQPANPKENTIWVNTETEITGWTFSATEPESPTDGMVWICTSAASSASFNALEENGIIVYPTQCAQYIAGQFKSTVAQVYQGGAWRDLVLYLYSEGNLCEDVTGGWEAVAWKYTSSTHASSPGLTLANEQMQISTSGMSYYTGGAVKSKTMVDLTKYKTLKLKGTVNINVFSTNYFRLFASNSTSTPWQNATATQSAPTKNGTFEELELDVSGLSGYYYIGIGTYVDETNQYSISANIDAISLVPKEGVS